MSWNIRVVPYRRNTYSRKIPLRICIVVATGFILAIVHVSQAQVTTNITPTQGTFQQGNLGTSIADPRIEGINTIHDITGGTRPGDGPNLFHSFDQLSIGESNVANFLNETNLPTDNILSRVTGSDPSKIFGTIQTTRFPDANLFLLNPAGVVFGPNAKIDVKGAFYASTADFVQLSQEGIFYSSTVQDSVLTAAAPEAFGFLGGTPPTIASTSSAAILVEGLEAHNGERVGLVGRDAMAGPTLVEGVAITGGTLQNSGGSVKIASVGGQQLPEVQQVSVNIETLNVQAINSVAEPVQEPVQLGGITLSQGAQIDTSGEHSGTVLIRGGVLTLDGSQISANTTGQSNGSMGSEPGKGIDIQVSQDLLFNGSIIQANVLDGSIDGKDISLKAGERIEIQNFSLVQTQALDGSGSAGDIMVRANTILLSQFSTIQSTSSSFIAGNAGSSGSTGNLFLEANGLQLEGVSAIATPTFGKGQSGNIQVSVEEGDVVVSNGFITANSFGDGNAGNVQLTTINLQLTDFSTVQSSSAGLGNPGSVTLKLDDNLNVREGASVGAFSPFSTGGEVNITAQEIFITGISDSTDPRNTDFTGFSTVAVAGQGGDINITTGNLHIADQGLISSGTRGPGKAGNVNIELTGNLFVSNEGGILSDTSNVGNGGNIKVTDANNISLSEGASIRTESTLPVDGAGDAGSIELTARDTITIDNSTITTQTENALGGKITLKAQELIQITNSEITSKVQEGLADAGSINIDPDFIVVQNSTIDSSANIGNGGDVTFVADSAILIDPFSTIDTSSQFGGSGTVDIRAPIQNLGETIAQLPEEILKVSGLFAARCAARKDGKFSSFLQDTLDGIPPGATDFLPSPLLFSSMETALPTTSTEARLDSKPNKVIWKFFDATHPMEIAEKCTVASHPRS